MNNPLKILKGSESQITIQETIQEIMSNKI